MMLFAGHVNGLNELADYSLDEVAAHLGITQQTAQAAERNAIRKLWRVQVSKTYRPTTRQSAALRGKR